MNRKRIMAAALSAAICIGALAGCGRIVQGTGQDMPPDPPQAMADSFSPAKDGSAPDAAPGYEFEGASANAATLEGLLSEFDSGTSVSMDAGNELGAITGDTAALPEPAGPAGTVQEELPAEPESGGSPEDPGYTDGTAHIPPEPVAAAPAPLPTILVPEAPGTAEVRNSECVIDYSNIRDGYFMSKWTGAANKIKLQSTGPSGVTYTYDLGAGAWSAFPLSDGNGHYDVRVMRNVGGTKYAVAGTAAFDASMSDEFAPFLRPNQYVNYENAHDAIALAAELCAGADGELEKVAAIYDWVVANLTYDNEKAKTVQSGYLPDLDAVLSVRKGICFDYAALMAGMLRSQGTACRLVVGYAGTAYHAWISVYVDGQGWVDGVIFFNGSSWQRMDPTYASTGKGSSKIMAYIGDGSNYSARYLY